MNKLILTLVFIFLQTNTACSFLFGDDEKAYYIYANSTITSKNSIDVDSDYFIDLKVSTKNPIPSTITWQQIKPESPRGRFLHPVEAETSFLTPKVNKDTEMTLQVVVKKKTNSSDICKRSIYLKVKKPADIPDWKYLGEFYYKTIMPPKQQPSKPWWWPF